MFFYQKEESLHQLIVRDGDNLINIFLDILEVSFPNTLHGSTVGNGIGFGEFYDLILLDSL